MNFFIALFKLKYSATGGLNRHKTGQVCLNIYIFVLFFSLLFHRLAVRMSLSFSIFYKVLLYRSTSTTGRSGTSQRFVAVYLLVFYKPGSAWFARGAQDNI